MKEQLIQYVNLLFAGATGAEDMKQEILQNTLDRYDDLIDQGKSPEAAYRLAISGIGDINEILGNPQPQHIHAPASAPDLRSVIHEEAQDIQRRKMKAVAVALYILCAIPLIVFTEIGQETLGLCMTLLMVASATVLIILSKKNDPEDEEEAEKAVSDTPKSKLEESIDTLVGILTLVIYLAVSFITHAWHITWVIFLISGCVKGLISAILDLKEAKDYEA